MLVHDVDAATTAQHGFTLSEVEKLYFQNIIWALYAIRFLSILSLVRQIKNSEGNPAPQGEKNFILLPWGRGEGYKSYLYLRLELSSVVFFSFEIIISLCFTRSLKITERRVADMSLESNDRIPAAKLPPFCTAHLNP